MSSRQHLSSFFVYILLVWQHLCCTSTPDQTLSCFFIYLAPQFITPPKFPQRPHSLLLEEKQGENPPNCVSPPYFDTIVLDPTSDCPVLCHLDLLEFASSGPYASSLQLECAVQLLQVFPSIGVTNTAKARWRCDAQNLAMSNENNVEAWKIMQYTSTKPMIEIVFTRCRPVDVLSHNRKTLYSLLAIERTNM